MRHPTEATVQVPCLQVRTVTNDRLLWGWDLQLKRCMHCHQMQNETHRRWQQGFRLAALALDVGLDLGVGLDLELELDPQQVCRGCDTVVCVCVTTVPHSVSDSLAVRLSLATCRTAVLELLTRAGVHAPHLREASAAILTVHGIDDVDHIESYPQLSDLRHEGRRLALRVVNKLWRLKNATSGESLWFCACVSAAHCTRRSCRFSCKHPRVCGTRLRCVVCRCVVPT